MRLLRFAGLLGLGLFLSACGGGYGGSNPTPPTGPSAILNGATLATATSHWVSAQCNVQVELTSDYGFWSIVVDTSGTKSSGSQTWAVGPDPNSVTVGPGSGLGRFFWVSALRNITGYFLANVYGERHRTDPKHSPEFRYLYLCLDARQPALACCTGNEIVSERSSRGWVRELSDGSSSPKF
jgi:hypothetical protein